MKRWLSIIGLLILIPLQAMAFEYAQPFGSEEIYPSYGYASYDSPAIDFPAGMTDNPLHIGFYIMSTSTLPYHLNQNDTQFSVLCYNGGWVSLQTVYMNLGNVTNNGDGAYHWISTTTSPVGSSSYCDQSYGIKFNFYKFFEGGTVGEGGIPTVIISDTTDPLDPHSVDLNKTEIFYIEPSGDQTIAPDTSFNIETGSYVAPADYQEGYKMRFILSRDADKSSTIGTNLISIFSNIVHLPWNYIDTTKEYTIDSDRLVDEGNNWISTSTALALNGRYTLKAEIIDPTWYGNVYNWISGHLDAFGIWSSYDPNVITATSTTFVIGELTSYDQFADSVKAKVGGGMASSTATSTIAYTGACTPFSTNFAVDDCLFYLLGWHGDAMGSTFGNIRNNLLSYAPIGYVSRFVTIAISGATTTIPAISYTFPSSSVLAGTDVSFDIWKYVSFTATGTPLADIKSDIDGDHKNVWQIFEPYYTFIIYLLLAVLVIGDILGIAVGFHDEGTGVWGQKKHLTKDEYAYKNRMYQLRNRK